MQLFEDKVRMFSLFFVILATKKSHESHIIVYCNEVFLRLRLKRLLKSYIVLRESLKEQPIVCDFSPFSSIPPIMQIVPKKAFTLCSFKHELMPLKSTSCCSVKTSRQVRFVLRERFFSMKRANLQDVENILFLLFSLKWG